MKRLMAMLGTIVSTLFSFFLLSFGKALFDYDFLVWILSAYFATSVIGVVASLCSLSIEPIQEARDAARLRKQKLQHKKEQKELKHKKILEAIKEKDFLNNKELDKLYKKFSKQVNNAIKEVIAEETLEKLSKKEQGE